MVPPSAPSEFLAVASSVPLAPFLNAVGLDPEWWEDKCKDAEAGRQLCSILALPMGWLLIVGLPAI